MKRVYLNTPEEVIKALKEGKIIKSKYGHTYKIVDGFIVDDNNHLNPIIDCHDYSELHIKEQEPLKIEVGKLYKTKGGFKARCFFKYFTGGAVFTIDFCSDTFKTDAKGKCVGECDLTNSLDIIGQWEEDK